MGRVKTTEHGDNRIARRRLKREWLDHVLNAPVEVQRQENGFFRYWGYIEEAGRYLRVVTLEDGKTIETAHFDRNYTKRRR